MPVQQIQRQNADRGIHAVALAPHGGIEDHGGDHQHQGVGGAEGLAGEGFPLLPGGHIAADQSQEKVEENGHGLVQVHGRHAPQGNIAEQADKGLIQHIVVPHALGQGPEAAAFYDLLVPGHQEHVHVWAGMVHAALPGQPGQGRGGEQKEPVTVLDQPVQNFSLRFGHMISSRRIFWYQYSTDDLRTQ